MNETVTEKTLQQFTAYVSGQHHAMAGATIAASAAQGASLGEACMRISQGDNDPINRLDSIRIKLLALCDQDANAIGEFVARREAGEELRGKQFLCQSPAEISRLAVTATQLLQDFRADVIEKVQDDLEMSITLMVGAAQAAMLLLDSNLRIWDDAPLQAEFEPIRAGLAADIKACSPAARVRR